MNWSKILTNFSSFQIVFQVITALTGIFIIRTLDKTDYALYTVIYSIQSAVTVLSELGISSVVLSIGGKIWNNFYELGRLMNSAKELRIRQLGITSILLLPFFIYLLFQQNVSIFYALAIGVLMIFDLFFKVSTAYLSIVYRFYSEVSFLLRSESIVQVVRLLFISLACMYFPSVFLFVFLTFLSSIIHYFLLSRKIHKKMDIKAHAQTEYKNEMIRVMKSQIVYSIFFVLQGQITIFIISFFGNTEGISDIGALSRLAMIFNLFIAIIVNYVSPIFSATQSITRLRKIYLLILMMFILFSLSIITVTYLFPDLFLWILGSKYNNLSREFTLMIFLTLITSLNGVLYTLNYSKAWIKDNWFVIPLTIVTQILLVYLLNLSFVENVILFGIISALPNLLVNVYMSLQGLRITKVSGNIF